MGARITESEIGFYNLTGYLVVEDLFSTQQCEAVLKIYKRYAQPDFRGIMNLERGTVEYKETVEGKEVVERLTVDEEDANTVWRMVSDPRMVEILVALQGAEAVHLQSMLLFKEAGSPYAKQAWNPHQDNAYPRADYGMYITGNIAFADQDPTNGGMFIYPGSHREPILPNVPVKSFNEKPGSNPGHCVEVPPQYRAVDLCLKKGAVLFLHGNVIHASYPNDSNRSRPMLLVPYGTRGISQGKQFIPGAVARRMEASLRGGHRSWKEAFLDLHKI